MEESHHSRKHRHKHKHRVRSHDLEHSDRNQTSKRTGIRSPDKVMAPHQLANLNQNGLSGDNDYVRRWLAQTRDVEEHGLVEFSDPNTDLVKRFQHQSDTIPTIRKNAETSNIIETRRKHRRQGSSDSSLLHVPVRTTQNDRPLAPNESTGTRYEEAKNANKRRKKVHSKHESASGSTASDVASEQVIFEKRARRKTREDRYEQKKRPEKEGYIQQPSRRKREKRGDQKKASRKASEELMNNFASNKISHDRLTVRPSVGPGIFKNGRASSPPRRRGLPDLTFSEMDFLRRSSNHPSAKDNTIVSKSRAKEKNKATREQNEIASFFKPPKTPLRRTSSTLDHPTSPSSIQGDSIRERQRSKYHDWDRHNLTSSTNRQELVPYGHDTPRTYTRFPREPTPQYQISDIMPGRVSKSSEAGTTFVTWSESQMDPRSTAVLREELDRCRSSSTPDSVRRSIERTGVFKDTGIETNLKRKAVRRPKSTNGDGESSRGRGQHIASIMRDHPQSDKSHSSEIRVEPPKIGDGHAERTNLQKRKLVPSGHGSRRNVGVPSGKDKNESSAEDVEKKQGIDERRIVIEYFDPERGWYKKDSDRTVEQSRNLTETPTSVLTRKQMARSARIRRPSTTLPIISEEESPRGNNRAEFDRGETIERTESAPVILTSTRQDNVDNQNPQHDASLEPSSEPSEPIEASPPRGQEPVNRKHTLTANQQPISVADIGRREWQKEDETCMQTARARPTDMGANVNEPSRSFSSGYTNTNLQALGHETVQRSRYERVSTANNTTYIRRSPLVMARSLYIQQLEQIHEQEQAQVTGSIELERLEQSHGDYVGDEVLFEVGPEEVNVLYNEEIEQEEFGGVEVNEAMNYQSDVNYIRGFEEQEAIDYQPPAPTGFWTGDLVGSADMDDRHLRIGQDSGYEQWNGVNVQQNTLTSWSGLEQQDPQWSLQHNTDHGAFDLHFFEGRDERCDDYNQAGHESDSMRRFWRPFQQY